MKRGTLLALSVLVALLVMSLPLLFDPATRGPLLDVAAPEGLAGFGALLAHWGASVEALEVDLAAAHAAESSESESRDGASMDSRGAKVRRAWTRSLEALEPRTSVVLAFPATAGVSERLDALRDELEGGRTVLVLYSGLPLAFEETTFMEQLGVGVRGLEERGRLAPWAWWRDRRQGYAHRVEALEGTGTTADERSLADGADGPSPAWSDPLRVVVDPAADCEQIAEFLGPRSKDLRPEGRALSVARCRVGEGELLLAPTSMLSNARLGEVGNLQVAAELAAALGPRVRFLEPGRAAGSTTAVGRAEGARRTINLVTIQLVVLYLVALLALARSFGPRWPRLDQPADTQRSFLLSVGALHRRLGDFEDAARTLHTRWLEYDPLARRRSEERLDDDEQLTEAALVDWAVRHSRRSTRSHRAGDAYEDPSGGPAHATARVTRRA